MRVDHLLMKGCVDKDLRVSFKYDYHEEERFSTIMQPKPDIIKLYPTFAFCIARSFEDCLYIPAKKYFSFVLLLDKTTKLISENLYKLFPDINDIEFGIDRRMLEVFQTEKALASNGITMFPCVWVNQTSECFPGIDINGDVSKPFRLPLEDAIVISQMLSVLDPFNLGVNLLRIIGKIE